jgi:hypothetical protein
VEQAAGARRGHQRAAGAEVAEVVDVAEGTQDVGERPSVDVRRGRDRAERGDAGDEM